MAPGTARQTSLEPLRWAASAAPGSACSCRTYACSIRRALVAMLLLGLQVGQKAIYG
jgi:hypothetical protein